MNEPSVSDAIEWTVEYISILCVFLITQILENSTYNVVLVIPMFIDIVSLYTDFIILILFSSILSRSYIIFKILISIYL